MEIELTKYDKARMVLNYWTSRTAYEDVHKLCFEALREKEERENPRLLTLAELKKRKHEESPVWIKSFIGRWEIIKEINDKKIECQSGAILYINDYTHTWFAYDYKPKEAK